MHEPQVMCLCGIFPSVIDNKVEAGAEATWDYGLSFTFILASNCDEKVNRLLEEY